MHYLRVVSFRGIKYSNDLPIFQKIIRFWKRLCDFLKRTLLTLCRYFRLDRRMVRRHSSQLRFRAFRKFIVCCHACRRCRVRIASCHMTCIQAIWRCSCKPYNKGLMKNAWNMQPYFFVSVGNNYFLLLDFCLGSWNLYSACIKKVLFLYQNNNFLVFPLADLENPNSKGRRWFSTA